MTDPTIHEQSHYYFLQESQELLQVLEQDLLSLREDYSINKINNLMRTTHTLKGAAASVGLETIATISHYLEDIFKALFNPELVIDEVIETLLFEGYECLRIPIIAEVTGGVFNETEVLERTAAIFALLQEKLGDCFGKEAYLPSSIELGFDVTQSIFEVGVTQRLAEIAVTLTSTDSIAIASVVRTQAEVFLGIAESLNLVGFGKIAQHTIAALDRDPEASEIIATAALADFQAGRLAVLNGDRISGGQPSLTLQELSGLETIVSESDYSETIDIDPNFSDESEYSSLDEMWGEVDATSTHSWMNDPLIIHDQEIASWEEELNPQNSLDLPLEEPEVTVKPPLPQNIPINTIKESTTTKKPVPNSTVRVEVKHLEHLNYSIGELLTNQNRQSLQNTQIRASVKTLITRLQQHQQQLNQLQYLSDRQFKILEQQHHRYLRVSTANYQLPNPQFDSLELDRYSEAELLVQSILEDAVQLAEATDAIDLFTRASNQTLEKQRRLLTSTRDSLRSAQMLPLGEIFGRCQRIVEQLKARYNKQVELELIGTEVLVDKVVAEKLYEPLLHLLRNAFDHGIESPNQRQKQGKATKGQIEICGYHQGKYLMIEVRDDGQGLDFEAIRQRAIEAQLLDVQQASRCSQDQLTDLLFKAGFSTASEVSDLSGRGVGLDVVKAQLQLLNGSIAIYSELDHGTRFVLQIPLSLTIAKLLLCQAGGRTYALLADAIEQILIPRSDHIRSWQGGKVLRWNQGNQERLIPIYSLSNTLDYFSPVSQPSVLAQKTTVNTEGKALPVILIRCHDHLVGLEVDQLMVEQELVIRPLGTTITPPSYVYGSSILADGLLTLVIDGAVLMQYVLDNQGDHRHYEAVNSLMSSTQHLLSSTSTQSLLSVPTRTLDKRVILVDDSITVRQTLAQTLQKAGYQVIQAKDGLEAIEQLQNQTDIQLVICDIEMPRMNGFEFLKYRQQEPTLAQIPVVILTSRSSDKHRLIATELGADDYITKPFLEANLLAILSDILQKNPQFITY
jgi:two-component system, chemotaxis family, sensor histidine kinase and response regulator PixL